MTLNNLSVFSVFFCEYENITANQTKIVLFLYAFILDGSAVLGGGSVDNPISFISRNTLIAIFEEVLRRLVAFMMDSTFVWVQDVCSFLFSGRNYSDWRSESSNNLLEMAHFALDILDGSLFCLNSIEAESELVQDILAAIFIIDWESGWINTSKEKLDEEQIGKLGSKLAFCEAVHNFRSKIFDQFLNGLGASIRKRLRTTLIQSIRCIMFADYIFDSDDFISSCGQWTLDIFEILCRDQVEEQELLEQFLSKNDSWPLWIIPDGTGARLKTYNVDHVSCISAMFSFSFLLNCAYMTSLSSTLSSQRNFCPIL